MRLKRKQPVMLPLTHALAWIVGSAFVVSVSAHLGFKAYFAHEYHKACDPRYLMRTLVQTGPQKQALKTEYLAQLMGISSDLPPNALTFDLKKARENLMSSPLIESAELKLIAPSTLYVDYTIRQPIAQLYDYENIVIDKEGYPFPLRPFLTPKVLPEIYLGLPSFRESERDSKCSVFQWGVPLKGKDVDLALHLIALFSDPQIRDLFLVKRIDVSRAFAESYGSREIVVLVEDKVLLQQEGRVLEYVFPKILRLSTQNYSKDLGNYLSLRSQLLIEERASIPSLLKADDPSFAKPKIIDLRIQNLAFIDEQKSSS